MSNDDKIEEKTLLRNDIVHSWDFCQANHVFQPQIFDIWLSHIDEFGQQWDSLPQNFCICFCGKCQGHSLKNNCMMCIALIHILFCASLHSYEKMFTLKLALEYKSHSDLQQTSQKGICTEDQGSGFVWCLLLTVASQQFGISNSGLIPS